MVDSESELLKLVTTLTSSGKSSLNEEKLKQLKILCKKSEETVRKVYEFIWSQLQKDHAEIRLSSFQLIDVLFNRSHIFRTLLLDQLNEFFYLVLGINPEIPLPRPFSIAKILKKEAAACFIKWNNSYGELYVRLKLGYNYLKTCKKFDFEHAAVNSNSNPVVGRLEHIRTEKVNFTLSQYNDSVPEIENLLLELKNLLVLLYPNLDEFDIVLNNDANIFSNCQKNDANEIDSDLGNICLNGTFFDEKVNLASNNNNLFEENIFFEEKFAENSKRHGFLSNKISLNVNINNYKIIKKSDDNEAIINNIKELINLFTTKYLFNLKSWIQILSKFGTAIDSIKSIIDTKNKIDILLSQAKLIKIQKSNGEFYSIDESDDDDDFVEVEELKDLLNQVKDFPHTNSAQEKDSQGKQPVIIQSNIEKKIPSIPFGLDLRNWDGNEEDIIPTRLINDGFSWWHAVPEDIKVDHEALATMRQRVIDYSGEFCPVAWKCRAPLKNGKLCFRMDRKKCPFHGLIIPRDNMGIPNGTTKEKNNGVKGEILLKDWEDPVLHAEIKAATGVDLTLNKNKKKRQNSENSQLTDLKTLGSKRKRLEAKLFKKSTIQRVAQTLDNMDAKKVKDKFGNNFNYTYTL